MHRQPLPTLLVFFAAACSAHGPDAAPTPPAAPPVPLPGSRHGHRVEALPGGLLALGGFGNANAADDRGARATFWLADGAPAWRRCADMPTPRAFFASVVHDGAVLAIGKGVDHFDVATTTWQPLVAPGTLPDSHFGAALVDGRIWVLGGYPLERSAFTEVDPVARTVERREPPPGFAPGDHFHFVVALRGELHVVGGLAAATFQPQRQHFVRRGGRWRALPPPPPGLWAKFAGSAVDGERLHLFGDFGHHVFDAAAGTWQARAPAPLALVMPATVARGGSLWVIGGVTLEHEPVGLLEYRVAADRWTQHDAPREGR